MINEYVKYLILAIVITAIPGPAVVLTIRNSIRYGYKVAIVNVIGNFCAMVLLATLCAIGVGAVIVASATLFSLLKLIGSCYLIYLGVRVWRAPAFDAGAAFGKEEKNDRKLLSIFQEGFGVGITNPKAIVFFVALFPQFIDPIRAYVPQFLTLIFTIEGISCIVLSTYAVLASSLSACLAKKRSMAFFNKITALAFAGFGLALLGEG